MATKAIRITAKRDGWRRAGIAHPAKPTTHAPDAFTAEQVEALKADPNLVVDEVEVEEPADDKGEGDKGDGKPPAKPAKAKAAA